MKLPEITLRRFIAAEKAFAEAEGWAAQTRAVLKHYASLEPEALEAMTFEEVLPHISSTAKIRMGIYNAEVTEHLTLSEEVLPADFQIGSYSMPRYSDAEVYLSVFSGPDLYVPLASVVYWPENQEYTTEAAVARHEALLDKPAHLVVPAVLFFCKAAMNFAKDTRSFSPNQTGPEMRRRS